MNKGCAIFEGRIKSFMQMTAFNTICIEKDPRRNNEIQ